MKAPVWLAMAWMGLAALPTPALPSTFLQLHDGQRIALPSGSRVESITLAPAGQAGRFVVQWVSGMPAHLAEPAALAGWLRSRMPSGVRLYERPGGLWAAADGSDPWMAVLGRAPEGEGWWWSRWHAGGPAVSAELSDLPAGGILLGDWLSSAGGREARHRVWAHPRWPVSRLREEVNRGWRAAGWRESPGGASAGPASVAAPQTWRRGGLRREAVFMSRPAGSAVVLFDHEPGRKPIVHGETGDARSGGAEGLPGWWRRGPGQGGEVLQEEGGNGDSARY
ncbi:MAG: hypothetical protein M0R28_10450 [Pigmentiphaga sp.]|nr:hypothetical protein [Pigmentiphaga sp.]